MQVETLAFTRFYHRHPGPTTYILLGGCSLALAYNVVLMQVPSSLPPPRRANAVTSVTLAVACKVARM